MKFSIEAGINLERAFATNKRPTEFVNPNTDLPTSVEGIPPTPVHRVSRYRALGRRMLRALRPLALPLLNRLDFRIRSAFDQSNMAAKLHEMDQKISDATARASNAAEITTGRVDGLVRIITKRLVEIEEKVGEPSARTAKALEIIMARLDGLAVTSVQAERTLDALLGVLEPHFERLDHANSLRMEVLDRANAQRIEALDGTFTQRLAPLQTIMTRLDVRSDLLVSRNIIYLGKEFAVRTAAGYLLVPVEDPAVLVGVIEGQGCLEFGTTTVLRALLRPGDVMIDAGSHIGTLTLPGARCVGAAGRVIALEPAPRLADLLRRTIELNHIGWVDVHECAAGEADSVAHFALSTKSGHHSLFPDADTVHQIAIPVRSLDSLIPSGSVVHVIKVDVEGAELLVWRGMQRILAENHDVAVILEFGPQHLIRAGVSIGAWLGELTAHGHTPWEIDEETGRLRSMRVIGLEDVFSLNILLLRGAPTHRGLVLV